MAKVMENHGRTIFPTPLEYFISTISADVSQSLHDEKMCVFEVPQTFMKLPSMERALKTG